MNKVLQALLTILVLAANAVGLGELNDLPLVEIPAGGTHAGTMAILVTGDGGWRAADRGIARTLAARGIPVVALNSLHYFWQRRTPERAAKDFERIMLHYASAWKQNRVIAIGYSLGADVLPFMLTRLPKSLLTQVVLVALLAPGKAVDFEFHLRDWFVSYTPKTAKPVLPELEKLKGMNILCFYGNQDGGALCRNLDPNLAKIIVLNAGHGMGRHYHVISQNILEEVR